MQILKGWRGKRIRNRFPLIATRATGEGKLLDPISPADFFHGKNLKGKGKKEGGTTLRENYFLRLRSRLLRTEFVRIVREWGYAFRIGDRWGGEIQRVPQRILHCLFLVSFSKQIS